jgi:2-polyprenyl-3-methyl-5-hydroxy-6-metoxy-1,4-benzoquinol methylase
MNPYRLIAHYYDSYLDHSLYEDFLALIQSEHLSGEALDLATGTGQMAFTLAKHGFQVDATDISLEMLQEAKKNLLKTDLSIDFHVHDIIEPITSKTYDVITLASDVVNHLSSIEDVYLVFQNIYLALRPGGVFVFDAIHVDYANSLVGYKDVLLLDDKELRWTVTKGKNNEIKHLLTVDQEKATLSQYIYSEQDLTEYLLRNSLIVMKTIRTSERTIFLTKREQ